MKTYRNINLASEAHRTLKDRAEKHNLTLASYVIAASEIAEKFFGAGDVSTTLSADSRNKDAQKDTPDLIYYYHDGMDAPEEVDRRALVDKTYDVINVHSSARSAKALAEITQEWAITSRLEYK